MDGEDAGFRRKAARMAALSGLARPVQHDINNLLTVVFANLEMLKRTAAAGGPQRQLDRIQEAARRFEGTSRAILSMLRRPASGEVTIRLSEVIGAMQPLLQLLLPAPGALTLEIAAEDWPVRLDRAALEEALLALAEQAAETLPRGSGIRLAVGNRGDCTELSIEAPKGTSLPALATLAALAEASGGGGTAEDGRWRLTLPQAVPAATPA
jgi:signal transduction histidine kinase